MENADDLLLKLAESEKRERDLEARIEEIKDFMENGAVPLHWVNIDFKIIWANRAELDLLGYTYDEFIGRDIRDFHADKEAIDDIAIRLLNGETVLNKEARLICKDGSVKYVMINSNVFTRDGQFVHSRCFTRDITAYKNDELKKDEFTKALELKNQQIIESEARFKDLANSAPVLLWQSGSDKLYDFFNKGWLDFTGKSMPEETGNGWISGIHPDDLEPCQEIYRTAFDARKEFHIEYRLKRHDGQYRWISENGIPRFTQNGDFLGYVGGCMDIHEQKNFAQELENQVKERTEELKTLNELLLTKNQQLEHSNEELSSFSYAASHDLQAPLRKIGTFTNFIETKDGANLSDDSRLYLNRISSATERMQALIDSLLDYSKINAEETMTEQTDLNQLFEEVKGNMNDLIEEKNVQIEHNTLPIVQIVPLQFQQVFTNLISNSIKYSKPGVRPHITIRSELVEGKDIESLGANPSVRYWKISIADNGIGFEQKYEKKIFELFHRLHGKNEYEGTGVGLGIVKKIILKHDGFIKATGILDQGAVFDVFIPEN